MHAKILYVENISYIDNPTPPNKSSLYDNLLGLHVSYAQDILIALAMR